MHVKTFFQIGSILAGIAVAAGAFGAHGLKARVSPELLDTWDKAVRYQMYHALAFLALAWAITQWPAQGKLWGLAGWFFLAGVLFFSGSLYILVLSGLKWLGAVTPLGGVAFVIGWGCLLVAAARS
ncbi:MAG: DUF423 domain-containing protein [Anaerolineales bacterium]|nr:DUF423 domain-containing protein [Anaerolineales bacterium]